MLKTKASALTPRALNWVVAKIEEAAARYVKEMGEPLFIEEGIRALSRPHRRRSCLKPAAAPVSK